VISRLHGAPFPFAEIVVEGLNYHLDTLAISDSGFLPARLLALSVGLKETRRIE
jgi:hypothetical protein